MHAFGGFAKRCVVAAVTVTAVFGTGTAAIAVSAGTVATQGGTHVHQHPRQLSVDFYQQAGPP